MRDDAALAEPDVPASAPDAAGTLLERQLKMLGDLAEIGLDIAQALAAQAKGVGPAATGGDIALAYDRVARAVRQAILLQSRLLDDAQARTVAADKALADVRGAADQTRQERSDARKCRLSWIVERVVEAGRDDRTEVDRLVREADERLDDDTLLGDVLARPISETVALICKDLGLDPDWTRLAQEAWAQEEIASGEVGWHLANFATSRHSPASGGGRAATYRHPPPKKKTPAVASRGEGIWEGTEAVGSDMAYGPAAGFPHATPDISRLGRD